jgi:osmotically-inducible protein OsmY
MQTLYFWQSTTVKITTDCAVEINYEEFKSMGFLGKLFGKKEEEKASGAGKVAVSAASKDKGIAPEKVGLDGQFDESGLAKRVAQAFDEAGIDENLGLWVAQTGSTVVLKYNPDAEGVLAQAEQIAKGVEGATAVSTVPNS